MPIFNTLQILEFHVISDTANLYLGGIGNQESGIFNFSKKNKIDNHHTSGNDILLSSNPSKTDTWIHRYLNHIPFMRTCLGIVAWALFQYNDVTMSEMGSQITSFTIVYSTVYSDADQKRHQSSASLAFVGGIHRSPVNSPHKWPVTWKMLPFDDVVMSLKISMAIRVGWKKTFMFQFISWLSHRCSVHTCHRGTTAVWCKNHCGGHSVII